MVEIGNAKTTNRVRRNLQEHQKESNRGHQEMQSRDHCIINRCLQLPNHTVLPIANNFLLCPGV